MPSCWTVWLAVLVVVVIWSNASAGTLSVGGLSSIWWVFECRGDIVFDIESIYVLVVKGVWRQVSMIGLDSRRPTLLILAQSGTYPQAINFIYIGTVCSCWDKVCWIQLSNYVKLLTNIYIYFFFRLMCVVCRDNGKRKINVPFFWIFLFFFFVGVDPITAVNTAGFDIMILNYGNLLTTIEDDIVYDWVASGYV